MRLKSPKYYNLKGRPTWLSFILFAMLSLNACSSKTSNMTYNKTPDTVDSNNHSTVSVEIVEKMFVTKNGKVTDKKEYYIRRSVQDYFIKLCESKITSTDLENIIASQKGMLLNIVNAKIEHKDGLWDNCNENDNIESRKGPYVVIYKIN